jgi:DeoR/GlpR family transcriptional regulator of sugar metabolism
MEQSTVNMLKKERHAFIINQINLHNKVLSSDLSAQLQVSEDTIRRDLNNLAESGKIEKVHGGALSKSFHFPYQLNEVYAQESKKEIARKAVKLLTEGMVVLTGGGTTMIEIARMIPDTLEATFFTISPLVALELSERRLLTVILLGGQLSKNAHINMGAKTVSELAEIKVDLCFLGANGINLNEGITDSDWEVVQIKKAMIRSSRGLAIMSLGEKLGSVQKMKVCDLGTLEYLITDRNENDPIVQSYKPFVKIM